MIYLDLREKTTFEAKRTFGNGLGPLMFAQAMLALSRQWRQRVRDRRHLLKLDDHVLSDIGLTRADVSREAARPFWKPLDPRPEDS